MEIIHSDFNVLISTETDWFENLYLDVNRDRPCIEKLQELIETYRIDCTEAHMFPKFGFVHFYKEKNVIEESMDDLLISSMLKVLTEYNITKTVFVRLRPYCSQRDSSRR